MASKKIIAVFGATGAQAGPIVQTFLSDPQLKDEWQVRGITRDVTKDSAKAMAAKGVQVVAADVNDAESVRKAVAGAHTVFAVTNYWEKMDGKLETEQGNAIADAAKEAGVQHFIWSTLVDVNKVTNGKLKHVYHFDSKAHVADHIRSIGLPATFFMPGFYMANLSGGAFRQSPPDDAWTLTLPTPADAPFPMFDTADSGKFVKAIVLNRDRLLGAEVLAATAYMTPTEMVDVFRKTFPKAGENARFWSIPHDAYLEMMKNAFHLPDYAALELLENMRLMAEGGYYGGRPLEDSLALLAPEDKPTTWEEHIKNAKAMKNLN